MCGAISKLGMCPEAEAHWTRVSPPPIVSACFFGFTPNKILPDPLFHPPSFAGGLGLPVFLPFTLVGEATRRDGRTSKYR